MQAKQSQQLPGSPQRQWAPALGAGRGQQAAIYVAAALTVLLLAPPLFSSPGKGKALTARLPGCSSTAEEVLQSLLQAQQLQQAGSAVTVAVQAGREVPDSTQSTQATAPAQLQPDAANQQPRTVQQQPGAAQQPSQQQAEVDQPPPAQQQPHCELDIADSPIAEQCKLLKDVCVDQGRIILYSSDHVPTHSNAAPHSLPNMTVEDPTRNARTQLPYRGTDKKWLWEGLEAIPVRPASTREPRSYLVDPAFSSCTVPVVIYEFNGFNFAHLLRENAAQYYSALRETAWADHARLVIMTAGGMAVPAMNLGLWQPLSKMRVDSWADFSSRLPEGQVGGADGQLGDQQQQLPPSFEGGHQRCFRHLYVCTNTVEPNRLRLHEYGQHLVRHYGGDELVAHTLDVLPPEEQQQLAELGVQLAPVQPPESVLRRVHNSRGQQEQQQEGEEVVLRVALQKRDKSTETRQVLNAAEVLERCNSWRYTAPSGVGVRALCWEVEVPTLRMGIAAAQQSDVFIGVHGANLANTWLMRPGSAAIELTPNEFEEHPPHARFGTLNAEDRKSQVQFWKLLSCDPNAFVPGPQEKRGIKKHPEGTDRKADVEWPKNRNLIVRWEALQTALEAVVDTAGDSRQYFQRWEDGTWWWLATDSATVPAGPTLHMTCRKARKKGLIQ